MFASHAINHWCLVVLACLRTTSGRASFLGVQLSECQKYTAKTRKPHLTFTPCLGIFLLIEIKTIVPSSAPTTVPRLLSTATETPSDACFLILTACSFIRDSCCVSCKSPSFLGFSVELFFHYLLPLSPKRYRTFLCIFSCTFSLYSTSAR